MTEESNNEGYSLLYILGIINSKLLSWYFPRVSNKLITNTFPRISLLDLKRFPFREIDFNNDTDRTYHDKLVGLVDMMIKYNEDIKNKKLPQEKKILKIQIDTIDKQIDQLVYQLYGLTDEEIKIVESEVL